MEDSVVIRHLKELKVESLRLNQEKAKQALKPAAVQIYLAMGD